MKNLISQVLLDFYTDLPLAGSLFFHDFSAPAGSAVRPLCATAVAKSEGRWRTRGGQTLLRVLSDQRDADTAPHQLARRGLSAANF